ncbi:MAG TPA: molybdate ABC transporter substrate-binding protein [Candidatus Xenobia bacterium]|jgi:molybdate transport system substrate-binding protein
MATKTWVAGLLMVAVGGCSPPSHPTTLTVLAAASLADVLPQLATPGLEVRYSFGASSLLVQQVLAGAPADVLISADMESQDPLVEAHRIQAPQALLSNQVVVLVRPDLAPRLHQVADLAKVGLRHLAVCEPAVPIGHYARQAVKAAGLDWDALPTVPVGDVRAVASAVDSGAADAGFVYQTDAAGLRHATVALVVPAVRAEYGLSLLHDTPAGRAFLIDLQTPDNQQRFRQAGFGPP